MSTLVVKVSRVDRIEEHPNADRLEVVHIGAWTTCVKKETFKEGDLVVFIPPDAVLPQSLHEYLGISKYCSELPKDSEEYKQGKRRVRATRLRGVRSFGTVMKIDDVLEYLPTETHKINNETELRGEESSKVVVDDCFELLKEGYDVSELLNITKYEPPERCNLQGDMAPDHPLFHGYTDIERYQNYPNVLKDDELVVCLEKCHGTLCRVGVVRDNSTDNYSDPNGELRVIAGSKKTCRKEYDSIGNQSLYWVPFNTSDIKEMLISIQSIHNAASVIVFCEVFGPKIQDMTYNGKLEYRVFDIAVDGSYLDWPLVVLYCNKFNIPYMPILYVGPFNHDILMEHTDGPTTIAESPSCKFKGREGCVVKPLQERTDVRIGRVILKSVSDLYLNRGGATDNA